MYSVTAGQVDSIYSWMLNYLKSFDFQSFILIDFIHLMTMAPCLRCIFCEGFPFATYATQSYLNSSGAKTSLYQFAFCILPFSPLDRVTQDESLLACKVKFAYHTISIFTLAKEIRLDELKNHQLVIDALLHPVSLWLDQLHSSMPIQDGGENGPPSKTMFFG